VYAEERAHRGWENDRTVFHSYHGHFDNRSFHIRLVDGAVPFDELQVTEHPLAVLDLAAGETTGTGPVESGGMRFEPILLLA
jgi:hypothetical protein